MNDVNKLFRVQLSKNQKEALVSFLFNFGEPQLRGSTLVKQINAKLDPNTVAKA
jgi:GH24 family phage-related lysozyme (muramidase)